MNIKKLFILFVIIMNIDGLYSQALSDSIKSVWMNVNNSDSLRFEAIENYYFGNTYAKPDSVIPVTKYHYQLAKEKGSVKQMAYALNERSYAYYIKGELNSSTEILQQSISLFEIINEPKNIAVIQSNLGSIYIEQKQYLKAFNSFNASLKIVRDLKLKTSEARILIGIGELYLRLDELDLAMEYFDESLTICIANKITKNNQIGTLFLKKAEIYFKREQYQQAIQYLDQAIKEFINTNNSYSLSECYLLLAKANSKLLNKERALDYLETSLAIYYEIDNHSKITEALILKSYLLLELEPLVAKNQAEEILTRIKPETSNEIKADLYKLLYLCYKNNRQPDKALIMVEQHTIFKDSVQSEKNKTLIVKETIKKDYEDKLQQNKAQNDKEKAIVKVTYEYKIYFIIAFTIFLIILFGFIIRVKNLKTRKELDSLLLEINTLKRKEKLNLLLDSSNFELNQERIQESINRKLNKTDWSVLNVLLDNPEVSNKEISEKVFLSIDGIGSSLRRMYVFFAIKETKYKKVLLIKRAIEISKDA